MHNLKITVTKFILIFLMFQQTNSTVQKFKFNEPRAVNFEYNSTDWSIKYLQNTVTSGTGPPPVFSKDFDKFGVRFSEDGNIILGWDIKPNWNCTLQEKDTIECEKRDDGNEWFRQYSKLNFQQLGDITSFPGARGFKYLFLESTFLQFLSLENEDFNNLNELVAIAKFNNPYSGILRELTMNISYNTKTQDAVGQIPQNCTFKSSTDCPVEMYIVPHLSSGLSQIDYNTYIRKRNYNFELLKYDIKVLLSYEHKPIKDLVRNVIQNYHEIQRIKNLDISGHNQNCYLTVAPIDIIFYGSQLQSVRIVNCGFLNIFLPSQITGPPSESLISNLTSGTVESLDLSGNKIEHFMLGLRGFDNLKKLNLSRQILNGENTLRLGYVSKDPVLYQNDLTSKFYGSLTQMPKLEVLDVSYTPLRAVDRAMFRRAPNLRSIHMRKCQVSILPEDTFLDLKFLTFIDLSLNDIATLHSNTFSNMVSSSTILLCCNNFVNVQPQNLSIVNLLDFSYNSFDNMSNLLIKGKIERFDFSGNKIKNWTSEDENFVKNHNIRHLNLSHNEISIIGPQLQDALIQFIAKLDIGGNPIDCSSCSLAEVQSWLKINSEKLMNLGTTDQFVCADVQAKGKPVLSAEYNPACKTNYLLNLGVPLGVVVGMALVIAFLGYIYRFEIAYMKHLWRVKQKLQKRKKSGNSTMESEFDAFVSYSSSDRQWVVDTLLPSLECQQEGYSLCLHERDFRLGSYIIDNIAQFIDSSSNVLLVLSPAFIASEWCLWELRMVQQRMFDEGVSSSEFLILIELERLDSTTVPSNLRLLMSTRTYLEWPSDGKAEDFWRRLKLALGPPHKRPQNLQGDNETEEDQGELNEAYDSNVEEFIQMFRDATKNDKNVAQTETVPL